MVVIPKARTTYCPYKECRTHTVHKVAQYKKGKESTAAQGRRRYDRKQSGIPSLTQVTEDRPNLSSGRRPRPPRKCRSGWSVPSARRRESSSLAGARQSFSWTSTRSKRRTQERRMYSIPDSPYLNRISTQFQHATIRVEISSRSPFGVADPHR